MQTDNILKVMTTKKIRAMAMPLKAARKQVNAISKQIHIHLIKITIIDDDINLPHWIKEVSTWLTDIDDITLKETKPKMPARYSLKEYLEHNDTIDHYKRVERAIENYCENNKTKSTARVYIANLKEHHTFLIQFIATIFKQIEDDTFDKAH